MVVAVVDITRPIALEELPSIKSPWAAFSNDPLMLIRVSVGILGSLLSSDSKMAWTLKISAFPIEISLSWILSPYTEL